MAEDQPDPQAELQQSETAATLDIAEAGLAEGQVHGGRYRIRSLLGRGGMGEVWRAYDLKLRLDVALKSLRPELIEDGRALERLRQEVRTAREVVSPNVCRVFDLEEIEGQEWISMEYVDGESLQEILRQRGPLELDEAREVASQFLAGLEAIHGAGLVHRDIKPENVMVTRTGRVVVMDFGIAKGLAEGRVGTVAGTPAYMAPEQISGEALDARADVYSAGVLLAEMVSPDGVRTLEARRRLWEEIRREPPRLAETPWAPVLKRALDRDRSRRPATASVLARALEEVTLRAAGDEDLHPYPGLAAFTAEDADYFFGREREVEEMWKKLQRPHLLALIGPSGAGKSSFLRAGLLEAAPSDWRAVIATPGSRPFVALGRALTPEFAGDSDVLDDFLRFAEPDVAVSLFARWRRRHGRALLILDQFEELFTQNPAEVREAFADLLRRLAVEADVHVLLSMRDDFLFACADHEALAPIFSELTPLKPLSEAALRRALVQPALKCGYRFEDDALVDEMVAEVREERGALPLLAFAAARLWEMRDRDQGLLVRVAYERIGGVAGALAQHAEATLERIGQERLPLVRELFRNLITAQGTRTARERAELLSVFPEEERADAREILAALVDARLLTSYEAPAVEAEEPGGTRLEIIHESLLSAWPRLVRWQTQDADSAQMRDQVRQAASVWDERGRSEDLLWSGTAYREFVVWRDAYPGGLSEHEQAFADAVTELAGRTRRRKRLALAAGFAVLLGVLAVISGFWKQSETARREAVEEARRAEASVLVSLGRNALEQDPSEALAYALASLELFDQEASRLLALEVLWRSPTALRRASEQSAAAFSPDGDWIALGNKNGELRTLRRDGGPGASVEGHEGEIGHVEFVTADVLATSAADATVSLWRIPDLEPIRTLPIVGALGFRVSQDVDGRPGVVTWEEDGRLKWWSVAGEEPIVLGSVAHQKGLRAAHNYWDIDPVGRSFVYGRGDRIYKEPLGEIGVGEAELIGVAPLEVAGLAVSPDGTRVATIFKNPPGLHLWALNPPYGKLPLSEAPALQSNIFGGVAFSADGAWLAAAGVATNFYLWDLEGPPGAEPLILHRRGTVLPLAVAFGPLDDWLLTVQASGTDLWPIGRGYPSVLQKLGPVWGIGAAPNGSWVAASGTEQAKIWPARRASTLKSRDLVWPRANTQRMAVSPDGAMIALGSPDGRFRVLAPDGSSSRSIRPFSNHGIAVAFGPGGRLLATGGGYDKAEDAFIRIWDLETDAQRDLDPGHGSFITRLAFTEDERLIESSLDGLAIWDLSTNTRRKLWSGAAWDGQPGPGGRSVVFLEGTGWFQGMLRRIDIDSGEALPIADWGIVGGLTVTRSGELVASTREGTIQIGALAGGRPHLLFGHEGAVMSTAEGPEWIVSGSNETGVLRIWPKPDVAETPFHLLPYDELLAKLRAFTNIRVVSDEESETGYRTEIGEFPGWAEVPEW